MRTSIKKTIAFALTLCAITAGTIAPNAGKLALSPTPIVAEAAQIGDFVFTRRSVAAATITSYTGTATSVTLPTTVTINGAKCNVSGIDSCAFFRNTTIKSVTIPYGYSCIGSSAFMDCSNLSQISIPSSICAIRNNAFAGTAITSFTIPSQVKILEDYAFSHCSKLKTVKINTNLLTELKPGIFSTCTSLTSVNIPSTIKKIGNNFAYGCTSLTSVTIPSGVTSLGYLAFGDCTNLSNVSLPSTLTDFEEGTFRNTKWIKNQPKSSGLVIRNRTIIDASYASGNVDIPSGVRIIPAYTFENNTAITKVTMPLSLEVIGAYAFSGCSNLSQVNLSNSLSEIPEYCFADCKKISSITLTNKIQKIGRGAFSDCTSLKAINFPEYLNTIENNAFKNCSSLNNITGINTNKDYTIDGEAFENCMNLKKLNGNTVVSCSGYNVSLFKPDFVKKYFSKTDKIGFIQDFIDKKSSAVVDQIKSQHSNYNSIQMAAALEEWMCANGCSAKENWRKQNGNTNYPEDLDKQPEYHRESSILMNGVGVCEGWAKGYNLLLQKAGICSEIVESQTHAWNVIYGNGKWFNIDAYWDDNGTASKKKWFMVSDAEGYNLESSSQKGVHTQQYVIRKYNDYEVNSEVISCTTPMGDVNIDGKLDKTDIDWMQTYISTGKSDKWFNYVCADMNFDGQVNSKDLTLLKNKIGK